MIEVKFLCRKEDQGKMPEPYPARKLMPDWYKHLPQKLDPEKPFKNNSTIKRCAPFLDALCAGWIIPLVGDVEIKTDSGAKNISWNTEFHRPLIENHGYGQVSGNPNSDKPPLKFLNWWAIKVPKGISLLFVPPLNRPDFRFQCFSGIVDAGYMGDGYLEFINFPFYFTQPNYSGIIKAGTPLVQVIPVLVDELRSSRTIDVGILTEEDEKIMNNTRAHREQNSSMYRDELWEHK